MTARSRALDIAVGEAQLAATVLTPEHKPPGVLFVHGWGGSQHSDLVRAQGIAGLGCVCLSFDLRGHGANASQQATVTREQNLTDLLAAYDRLAGYAGIDSSAIAVMGNSYGAYLAALLTTLRPVRWLSLTVPALYRDHQWQLPKGELDREDLARYRRSRVAPPDNRALAACAAFTGDVLLIEAERDDIVPHQTLLNYRAAFENARSLTYRVVEGAEHAMERDCDQQAYTTLLVSWATEMIVGRRIGAAQPVS